MLSRGKLVSMSLPTNPFQFLDEVEDEELDEPELYEWTPYCWDDCETCGCHGLCDGEPWEDEYDDED